MTVGRRAGVEAEEEVVEKPNKRVKKEKTKQRVHFDLLRVRAALSSGSKIDQRT